MEKEEPPASPWTGEGTSSSQGVERLRERAEEEQQRPEVEPPGRRLRMRDLMSMAVRGALADPTITEEAERFNREVGETFNSTLGADVKKEK